MHAFAYLEVDIFHMHKLKNNDNKDFLVQNDQKQQKQKS